LHQTTRVEKEVNGEKQQVQKTLEKSKWVTVDLSNGDDPTYAKYNINPRWAVNWMNQRIQTLTQKRQQLQRQFKYVENGQGRNVNVASLRQYGEQRYAEGKVLRSLIFTAAADINANISYNNPRLAGESKPLANASGTTDASGYSMVAVGATRGDRIEGLVRFENANNNRNAKRGSELRFEFDVPDYTRKAADHTVAGIPAYRLKASDVTVRDAVEIGAP
jgi:hypothetical protein